MRPPGVPHWTEDEVEFLQAFVARHGHNWVRAARELRSRFGARRPYASDMIRKKWHQICLKTGEPETTPVAVGIRGGRRLQWSEVEEQVLVALVDELGPDWPAVAHGLADRLGELRKYTARTVKVKFDSLADRRPPKPNPNPKPFWTTAHDDYLTMLSAMYDDDWDKISEIFAKRFGSAMDVTADQLRTRAVELAARRPVRRAAAATTPTRRRRRVDFDSSSDEIAERKPKLPKKRKTDLKARKSIAVPPTAEMRAAKPPPPPPAADGDGTTTGHTESGGDRPRSKSCSIQ